MDRIPAISPSVPAPTRPTLSWVPVTGPDGRIRMEMRWHVGSRHLVAKAGAAA